MYLGVEKVVQKSVLVYVEQQKRQQKITKSYLFHRFSPILEDTVCLKCSGGFWIFPLPLEKRGKARKILFFLENVLKVFWGEGKGGLFVRQQTANYMYTNNLGRRKKYCLIFLACSFFARLAFNLLLTNSVFYRLLLFFRETGARISLKILRCRTVFFCIIHFASLRYLAFSFTALVSLREFERWAQAHFPHIFLFLGCWLDTLSWRASAFKGSFFIRKATLAQLTTVCLFSNFPRWKMCKNVQCEKSFVSSLVH